MDTNMIIPDGPEQAIEQAVHDTNDVFAQYHRIACSAISDAEAWLRQDALSRAITEAMPDAVIVTDEAGRILLVNAQFELMFGYHRSEVIGKASEMLMPQWARARHVEHRRGYADDPRVRNMGDNLRLMGRRKDGVEFRVLIRLGPAVTPAGTFTIVVIRRVRE